MSLPKIAQPITWISALAGGNLILRGAGGLIEPLLVAHDATRLGLWIIGGLLVLLAAFCFTGHRFWQTVVRAFGIWLYGDIILDASFDVQTVPLLWATFVGNLLIGVAYSLVAIWTRITVEEKDGR